MSNSAVKKLQDQAERGGYLALIAKMNELTVDDDQKKTKPKPKTKAKTKADDKKESPEVTDELRDAIRGFFHKKKNDKEAKSLFVGSSKKRKPAPKKRKRRRPGQPKE
jgi:hypothetical protein